MHMHEIIEREIARYLEVPSDRQYQDSLRILETGTIRCDTEEHRQGDGWSTLALARHAGPHGHVTSVDLSVDVARTVIEREQVADRVSLRQGYSIDVLAEEIATGAVYDVILLDSENDPQLILHEWMLSNYLLARPGLLLVDDVVPGSSTVLKGQLLLRWLIDRDIPYRITTRTGGGVRSGVLSAVIH